jgi:geranylgeranyl pyrophosphate synthase
LLKGLDERTAAFYAPIQFQLGQVEQKLRGLSRADTPYLEPLLEYVLANGGKRIRPAVTLLASEFYPHHSENPITMATAVELLHLATLIHDDTVDNSDLRRGKATVGSLLGQHVAVLFGDYIFATSATFVCDTGNVRVIRRFSEAIMHLASGELIEYFNAFNVEQARELYLDRIYRKTASLFCTSAETGAILGGAPEPQVQALRTYGYNIGMAFQIVDDLLDVQGDVAELGKPVGNDLLQGVLTLPTIMLMERYPDDNPISGLFKDRSQDGKLKQALEMVNNSTIVDDCQAVIRGYCEEASRSLDILPDCPGLHALLGLSDYIWERSH